jgi:hypothetical protein
VNQSRGLERVTGSLIGHLVRCQFAQFLINQRQQFTRSVGVAAVNRADQSSDFTHKNMNRERAMLSSTSNRLLARLTDIMPNSEPKQASPPKGKCDLEPAIIKTANLLAKNLARPWIFASVF